MTAENTAIVLDSTADFPEAPQRFANWRVVPLYVRFGDESFRDYVELSPDAFYERLRGMTETPTTSQPTPGDFLTAYEELAGYERILSLHIPLKLSGTVESARRAGEELGGGNVRAIDSGTVSAGLAMLALAVQRRLELGTTDEEVDSLVARFQRDSRIVFTVDTLESLRGEGELFLILGSDAYADFESWREPARIRELATIVLAARPGAPNAPAGVRMLDSPLMDISSRELRARAARGRSLRYLVPKAALRYIEEHRLYR